MPNLRLFVLIVFCLLGVPAGVSFFAAVHAADQASLVLQASTEISASTAISVNPANSMGPANSANAENPASSVAPENIVRTVATRPPTPQPGQDELYDPSNPDYNKLQKANESLAGFMLDKKQYVNWMDVLRANLISPRADLTGKASMLVMNMDIIMKNTKEMPYVKFPHKSHTMWLACSNCHEQIFLRKAGANKIDMAKIFRGQYCGVCHGKVAFGMFFSCETCHSVPQAGTSAWWN